MKLSKTPPVLFVVFNREEVALKSLESIRQAAPSKIYIAGDGPRPGRPGEMEKVQSTRNAILQSIDWDCEVYTQFQENNLGCGPGVYTAINWFFQEEAMGIILEDDCVAKSSFFDFASDMLVRYRDDSRIALVSGHNPVQSSFSDYSYCFSKYVCCWGWASWRRAWQNMDFNMDWRNSFERDSVLFNMGYKAKDTTYWKNRIKAVDANKVSAWDWQWCFSVASQNQLTIFPDKNLVSNIGFGDDATHTSANPLMVYTARDDLKFPLNHPKYVLPNFEFDHRYFKDNNHILKTVAWYTPKKIKDWVKKLIAKFYQRR